MVDMGRLNKLLVALLDIKTEVHYLATFRSHTLRSSQDPQLVVCMTSYPARIRHAWLSLESLFRQSYREIKLVLVLAESQFPDRRLPWLIRQQVKKGLEIIWVPRDGGSFDHVWPAYQSYPKASIISVDDDKFFAETTVAKLKSASDSNPGVIVGWRGWKMRLVEGRLKFGEGWERATVLTPSRQLFIPPGNGSLYPPGSLPELTGDYGLRESVCPNADDVWYWAMARKAGTSSLCLGEANHRAVWQQSKVRALAALQPGPREFQQVVDRFGFSGDLRQELAA